MLTTVEVYMHIMHTKSTKSKHKKNFKWGRALCAPVLDLPLIVSYMYKTILNLSLISLWVILVTPQYYKYVIICGFCMKLFVRIKKGVSEIVWRHKAKPLTWISALYIGYCILNKSEGHMQLVGYIFLFYLDELKCVILLELVSEMTQ